MKRNEIGCMLTLVTMCKIDRRLIIDLLLILFEKLAVYEILNHNLRWLLR
jgi:hypothetical protein